MTDLTQEQMNILEHTLYRAANAHFCGNSSDMQVLVNRGLMISAGFKPLCNDEYFELTATGRELLGGVR